MNIFVIVSSLLMAVSFVSVYYLAKDRRRLLGNSRITSVFEILKKKSFGQQFDDLFKETDILPVEYVFCQVGLLVAVLVIALRSNLDIVKIIFIVETGIHAWMFQTVQKFRKKLRTDLCVIQETLYYQADVGTPLSDTLAYAAELIDEPMKSKMHGMAATFRLKQDVDDAIRELRHLSPIHELQAFCNILAHHLQTGSSEEAHEASLAILLQLKRGELLIKRKSNRFFVTAAFFLLAGTGLVVMVMPMLLEAYTLFKSAFRT